MSYSTILTVSVLSAKACFICNCEIISLSLNKNKSDRTSSEFTKNNRKVCQLFCHVASRYLNFKCGHIKPEETIRVNSEDKDDINKSLLCEYCFPLAESFCEIFHEFKYFEQFFHWRMKEVIDLIQAQLDKFVDNDKDFEAPEKQKCYNFRRKFIKLERENVAVKDFPRLQLVRLKELSPQQLRKNSEDNSQMPEKHEKEMEQENVARDEVDVQIVKVDISSALEYNNEGNFHHHEDKFTMYYSTFPTMSASPTQNCFICSGEIILFTSNTPHRQFSEDKGKVCELFCRIASRYLNFKCDDIKPEHTISVSDDNSKHLLCKNCFPLAESMCEIYHEFKYFEQFFHCRMKEVIDLIQMQMRKFADKGNNVEIPEEEKSDRANFRRKFIKRGKENCVVNQFPKLHLVRLKKLSPERQQNISSQNSEEYSQIVQNYEEEVEQARADFNLNVSETPTFNCRVCLKTFRSLHYLETHQNATHKSNNVTEVTVYKCDVCGKMFPGGNSLRCHKLVHSDRIHQCEICLKKFHRACHFAAHQRRNTCSRKQSETKTKEKEICRFCGKSFASNSLRNHERIHFGTKPYQCKICGKAFRTAGILNVHERVHSGVTPYKCAICGMQFRHNSALKAHGDAKHPGEHFDKRKIEDLSLKCGICNKVFESLAQKTDHVRLHALERHYQCIFCVKRYRIRQCCDRHQQNCHGKVNDDDILTQNFYLPYNEAHVDAVIENVARDECDVQMVKVDIYGSLEYSNGEIYHEEDKFILPD